MHELSLVMGIIDPASLEAEAHGALEVQGIVVDIGEPGVVEMESFDFAWNRAVKGVILEGTERTFNLRIN